MCIVVCVVPTGHFESRSKLGFYRPVTPNEVFS